MQLVVQHCKWQGCTQRQLHIRGIIGGEAILACQRQRVRQHSRVGLRVAEDRRCVNRGKERLTAFVGQYASCLTLGDDICDFQSPSRRRYCLRALPGQFIEHRLGVLLAAPASSSSQLKATEASSTSLIRDVPRVILIIIMTNIAWHAASPCIRGMRVTVRMNLGQIAAGASVPQRRADEWEITLAAS
jgi:hypothetical protein